MNWFVFFQTISIVSATATLLLALYCSIEADTAPYPAAKVLLGLFILTVITGAIAGGLS